MEMFLNYLLRFLTKYKSGTHFVLQADLFSLSSFLFKNIFCIYFFFFLFPLSLFLFSPLFLVPFVFLNHSFFFLLSSFPKSLFVFPLHFTLETVFRSLFIRSLSNKNSISVFYFLFLSYRHSLILCSSFSFRIPYFPASFLAIFTLINSYSPS